MHCLQGQHWPAHYLRVIFPWNSLVYNKFSTHRQLIAVANITFIESRNHIMTCTSPLCQHIYTSDVNIFDFLFLIFLLDFIIFVISFLHVFNILLISIVTFCCVSLAWRKMLHADVFLCFACDVEMYGVLLAWKGMQHCDVFA